MDEVKQFQAGQKSTTSKTIVAKKSMSIILIGDSAALDETTCSFSITLHGAKLPGIVSQSESSSDEKQRWISTSLTSRINSWSEDGQLAITLLMPKTESMNRLSKEEISESMKSQMLTKLYSTLYDKSLKPVSFPSAHSVKLTED